VKSDELVVDIEFNRCSTIPFALSEVEDVEEPNATCLTLEIAFLVTDASTDAFKVLISTPAAAPSELEHQALLLAFQAQFRVEPSLVDSVEIEERRVSPLTVALDEVASVE
jgi:hypothetical protein